MSPGFDTDLCGKPWQLALVSLIQLYSRNKAILPDVNDARQLPEISERLRQMLDFWL